MARASRRVARVIREVQITGDTIKLGQLLKLAGIAGSGSEAKDLLLDEQVFVNGEPEARRGRQLHPGDVVRAGEDELRVAAS
jgi:ribosome-associated protein